MIFVEPAKPAVTATTTAQQPAGDVTIAAGTAIDYEGAKAGYAPAYTTYDNDLTSTFTLAGTLWASDAVAVNVFNLKDFNNSGTLVSDSSTTQAIGIENFSTWDTLENTGTIEAVSRAPGTAVSRAAAAVIGVDSATNSGLIAAYSANGVASGIAAGALVNGTGGQILAEGNSAVAVSAGSVVNRGLIEAVAYGTEPAVGIEAAGVNTLIDNYGTITADVAIANVAQGSPNSSFVPIPGQVLVNHAGAVINGDVDLGVAEPASFGGDGATVRNTGTINGAVVLSAAYNLVDTRQGVVGGPVIFADGTGVFLGSTLANNAVQGGRGTDLIIGGTGNDLLVGGAGIETLVTAHGNSGLYAGSGTDLVFASGGDAVHGGTGTLRLVLGDWSFAHVDGGSGAATLVLPQGGRDLDLHAALATARIAHFGTIELATGQTIEVSAGDAAALAGANVPLMLTGQGTGTVDLVGAWVKGAAVTSGGTTWQVYTLGSDVVRIAPALAVQVTSAVGVGAKGLDAVAGGVAAPTAAGKSWVELPASQYTVSGYDFRDLTVSATETLTNTSGGAALTGGADGYGFALVNHGTITSSATGAGGAANAVALGGASDAGTIVNTGTISSSFADSADQLASEKSLLSGYGALIALNHANDIAVGGLSTNTTLNNSGTIAANSPSGEAVATSWVDVTNSGHISATSNDFAAVGVWNGNAVNAGSITATGKVWAIGVEGSVINSGTITATAAGGTAIGVTGTHIYTSGMINPTLVINSGTITATTAIGELQPTTSQYLVVNTGTINGAITVNTGKATGSATALGGVIVNHGRIAGDISLGSGTDVFFGVGGTVSGTITAGSGADGIVVDSATKLAAGTGADTFVFTAPGASTAAQPSVISGFKSGTDVINLAALGLGAVQIATSGGVSTITASGSTFVLKVNGTVAQSDIVLAGTTSATTSAGHEVLVAAAAGATLTADTGNAALVGGAGNDRFVLGNGGYGNGIDTVLGGGGADTAVLSGNQSGYALTENADGSVTIGTPATISTFSPIAVLYGVQRLEFADTTVDLSAANVALQGGGHTLLLKAGQSFSLSNSIYDFNPSATPVNTLTGSNGTVALNYVSAAITGSNNTITATNKTNQIVITGSGNTLTDSASGDTVTIGGNGQGATSLNRASFTAGGTVVESADANVALTGNGLVVTMAAADTLSLAGNGAAISLTAMDDVLTLASGATPGAANHVTLRQAGTVNLADGANADVAGNGGVIHLGANAVLAATGLGLVINATGAGNTITVGGNGTDSTAPDTVNLASGGHVVVLAGSRVDVAGANAAVTLSGRSAVTVSGGGALVVATGSANRLTIAGSGTITIENAATVELTAAIAAGQSLVFDSHGARAGSHLVLDVAGDAAVSGLMVGDTIDFAGRMLTGASISGAVLTLSDAKGVVARFTSSTSLAGLAPVLAADGTGGTVVSFAAAAVPTLAASYTLKAGINTIAGDPGANDLFLAGAAAIVAGTVITGGALRNRLRLVGAGQFDLNLPTTLTRIDVIEASEGQFAYGTTHRTRQLVVLRDGATETLNIASVAAQAGNPLQVGINIRAGSGTYTITLGTGHDALFLGSGTATVQLGRRINQIYGGSGRAVIYGNVLQAGALIQGAAPGTLTLALNAAGHVVLDNADTNLAVLLRAGSTLDLSTRAGVIGDGSAGHDTITAHAAGQTLIGGNGDTLVSAGGDVFDFSGYATGQFGTNVISGFVTSGANHDVLAISRSVFADWAHLIAAGSPAGNDFLISVDAGDTILIKNATYQTFTSADVRFV